MYPLPISIPTKNHTSRRPTQLASIYIFPVLPLPLTTGVTELKSLQLHTKLSIHLKPLSLLLCQNIDQPIQLKLRETIA